MRKLFLISFFVGLSYSAAAQLIENNGSQVLEIGKGGGLINHQISKQTSAMTKTSITIGAIATMFLFIKDWEGKYNSYLLLLWVCGVAVFLIL